MLTLNKTIRMVTLISFASVLMTSCKKDDDNNNNNFDTSGTYMQKDQMGRPGISTVFIDASMKDQFNMTTPSEMSAAFKTTITNKLTAFGFMQNALGQSKDQFASLLSTDVLNAKTSGTTTFFDGTNVLTGRKLDDDVIDTELLLIFGGSTGASNPGLTSDHVDANDKAFSNSFPYLASPW